MHPLFPKASSLTQAIIGAAIEVHRDKGPGLVESIYEWCLSCELALRHLTTQNQKLVTISYKGFTREEPLRFDVLGGAFKLSLRGVPPVGTTKQSSRIATSASCLGGHGAPGAPRDDRRFEDKPLVASPFAPFPPVKIHP